MWFNRGLRFSGKTAWFPYEKHIADCGFTIENHPVLDCCGYSNCGNDCAVRL
jgi:hypothetical protein